MREKSILRGFQEFLSQDANETSNKSPSVLRVLRVAGANSPDKRQDAQFDLNIK